MPIERFIHKSFFRARSVVHAVYTSVIRKVWWRIQGMAIGAGTVMSTITVNWPHKVSIGRSCILEPDIFFKFDGIWSPGRSIEIGDGTFIGRGTEFNIVEAVRIGADSLIGSACKFIDHNHGIAPDQLIGPQPTSRAAIVVGSGVWLGANVLVLEGVSIGDGAVIGAGAVVRESVPANEIWVGVPARRIGSRSDFRAAKIVNS